ncbi:MAG: histidine kinase dimerization/phospho-acceptor domain-containing protein [Candidatus Dojkabacteria bacterium]|nr:histidine kinase dimerization/phospho-acceptor domain-containing protein [Candidatus Dojkabacteria bacterium]
MTENIFHITDSFFHSVLDSIGHDVIIVSNDLEMMYMNVEASINLFRNYEQKSNENFLQMIADLKKRLKVENSDELDDLIKSTSNEINFITSTILIKLNQRGEKFYEISTSPIYDSKKGHLGRIWQFRNVTERETMDTMKTEFISIASHQLRTPLTSIRGYTDMIISGDFGEVNEELNEPLDAIKVASSEMGELINDLLNISRLERTDQEIKIVKFSIKEVISKAIDELSTKALEKIRL